MDTGLHYKTLDEELDKCPTFTTPQQVTLMIDLLVAREASWQSGTMLIQNIFSCLQFEDLVLRKLSMGMERSFFASLKDALENKGQEESKMWPIVLDAYMIGLAKTTGLALSKFKSGIICPDEDVGTHDFGANFLEHIDTKDIIAVLDTTSKWVRAQRKQKIAENDESAASSLSVLLNRLEFRTELIYIVNEKKQPKKSHLTLALGLIEKILASEVLDVNEKDYDVCFTSGVQSRISNTNPLRSTQKLTFIEAYSTYRKIITSIEGYRPVQGITRATDLLAFFVSSATQQDTLPLARVFLQVIAQVSNSNVLGQRVLTWALEDLKETTGPRIMSLLVGPKGNMLVDNSRLLTELAVCYEDLLKANMVNRARQRQNLAHCIVSWDTLQVVTEEFEEKVAERAMQVGGIFETVVVENSDGESSVVPALPISSWVYLRKVQMMIWVVLLGFELDIYKIWEYAYMYRYVSYLVMTQAAHLQRTLNYMEQAALNLANGGKTRGGAKSQSKSSSKTIGTDIQELQGCLQYLTGLSIEATVLSSLCDANMYLAEAAVLAGYAARPAETTSHTSTELLYGLRMKPFSSVGTPELPPYDQMIVTDLKEGANVLDEVKQRLVEAKKASLACRSAIDRLGPSVAEANPELRTIKRSAVGIAVSCSQLESHASKKFAPSPDPALDQPKLIVERKNYHWYFPVLTFAPATKK